MAKQHSRAAPDAQTQKLIRRFEKLNSMPKSPSARAARVLDDQIMALHYEGKSVSEISEIINADAQVIKNEAIRRVIARYEEMAEIALQLEEAGVILLPDNK